MRTWMQAAGQVCLGAVQREDAIAGEQDSPPESPCSPKGMPEAKPGASCGFPRAGNACRRVFLPSTQSLFVWKVIMPHRRLSSPHATSMDGMGASVEGRAYRWPVTDTGMWFSSRPTMSSMTPTCIANVNPIAAFRRAVRPQNAGQRDVRKGLFFWYPARHSSQGLPISRKRFW